MFIEFCLEKQKGACCKKMSEVVGPPMAGHLCAEVRSVSCQDYEFDQLNINNTYMIERFSSICVVKRNVYVSSFICGNGEC